MRIRFTLVSILAVVAGCSSSNMPVVLPTGAFAGHISVLDSNGYPLPNSGTTVSIPTIGVTTSTDSLGMWTLSNLPIGTYTITATRPGYGTMKWIGQHVTGSGIYYEQASVLLWPLPRGIVTLDSFAVNKSANTSIQLTGTVANSRSNVYLYVAVDSDSTTLPNEPHLAQSISLVEIQNQGRWHASIYASNLSHLPSGTSVFVSVYVKASDYYGVDAFYDPVSDQFLPVSAGKKSNCLRVKLP